MATVLILYQNLDACITDPPYNYDSLNFNWNSKDIKEQLRVNTNRGAKVSYVPSNSRLGGTRNSSWYKKNAALDADFEQSCLNLCGLVKTKLKPGGFFAQFCDTKSTDIVGYSHRKFFHIKDVLVWVTVH